jgi:hypothetical protein
MLINGFLLALVSWRRCIRESCSDVTKRSCDCVAERRNRSNDYASDESCQERILDGRRAILDFREGFHEFDRGITHIWNLPFVENTKGRMTSLPIPWEIQLARESSVSKINATL